MTDPLAGMSVKEARELVAGIAGSNDEMWGTSRQQYERGFDKLLALAALGAECVGAERMVWKDIMGMPPGTHTVLVLKEDKRPTCDFTESHVCQYPQGCLCRKEDR